MANNRFFQSTVNKAIDWLFMTQNEDNFGWAWVRDISPNIQNTCEVLVATSYYIDSLSDLYKEQYKNAVDYWLIDPYSNGAAITIEWVWVIHAIKKVLDLFDKFEYKNRDNQNETFSISKEELKQGIKVSIEALDKLRNNDNGFPENPGQLSNTIRTALVIIALTDISNYIDDEEMIKVSTSLVEGAVDFVLKHQNSDGGFDNISEFDMNDAMIKAMDAMKISGKIREEQYLSSDAVTAYCVLALASHNHDRHYKAIKKGNDFLINNQHADGGFDILFEVNMKETYVYTFRHFGLAWAILALCKSDIIKVYDKSLNLAIKNLLSLQDMVDGGFMSNPNSDCYTWATCNALTCFAYIEKEFLDLSGDDYNAIIYEWWQDRHKPVNKPKVVNILSGILGLIVSILINIYLICSVVLNFTVEGTIIITLLSLVIIMFISSIIAYIIYRVRMREKKNESKNMWN